MFYGISISRHKYSIYYAAAVFWGEYVGGTDWETLFFGNVWKWMMNDRQYVYFYINLLKLKYFFLFFNMRHSGFIYFLLSTKSIPKSLYVLYFILNIIKKLHWVYFCNIVLSFCYLFYWLASWAFLLLLLFCLCLLKINHFCFLYFLSMEKCVIKIIIFCSTEGLFFKVSSTLLYFSWSFCLAYKEFHFLCIIFLSQIRMFYILLLSCVRFLIFVGR